MIMKNLKLLFVLFVAFMFSSSCDVSSRLKVHTPDITIQTINGMRYAYYEGKAYSGDVYSFDEKNKMVIKNGIAVVAYANQGVTTGGPLEKEIAIYEDIYSLQNKIANSSNSDNPWSSMAGQLYTQPKIEALRTLPNCSFAQ